MLIYSSHTKLAFQASLGRNTQRQYQTLRPDTVVSEADVERGHHWRSSLEKCHVDTALVANFVGSEVQPANT